MLVRVVDRPTDADLDDARGIEQAFLGGAPERCAVGVGIVAEVAVIGVRMRVEVHHADRSRLRDGAQHRQRNEVVAAGDEWRRAMLHDRADALLDAIEQIAKIDRVDGEVTHVGDAGEVERLGARSMMHAPHQGRLVS